MCWPDLFILSIKTMSDSKFSNLEAKQEIRLPRASQIGSLEDVLNFKLSIEAYSIYIKTVRKLQKYTLIPYTKTEQYLAYILPE